MKSRRRRRLRPHADWPGAQGEGLCSATCGATIWPSTCVKRARRADGHRPGEIEDVVLGNTQQKGEQGFNAARAVALMAGLPVADRRRDGQSPLRRSLQALNQAAHAIMAGFEDVQIVGGLEHMQHLPMDPGLDLNPKLFHAHEQGRAAHGRHGRVPRPDARHLARGAGRVRPAQPPAGGRGAAERRVQGARSCPSMAATKRAIASWSTGDQCVRPDTSAGGAGRARAGVHARDWARSRPATARR